MTDIVSDDFRDDELLGIWTATLPSSSTASVVHAGAESYLSLVLPDGEFDAWFGQDDAARLLQATSDTDFEVEAKYLSEPTTKYQMQGILVQQDADNWLRFDLISFSGGELRVFAGSTIGGVSTARIQIANVPSGEAAYLRVNRTGDTWTLSYSGDGQSWTLAGSFDQALNVTAVGPFAGSHGDSTGYEAQLDYFYNTAAPLAYEDPAPVAAVDDDIAALPDVDTSINVTTEVLANDQDGVGAGLSLASFGQPGHGATALDDNGTPSDPSDDSIVYTPNGGYLGPDSFTYTVQDAAGQTADGTVNVTVSDPTNTAPAPVADTAAVDEDGQVVVDVLGNDDDPDGDPLTITAVTDPAHGTAVIDDNGTPSDPSDDTVVYTPDADYNGPDSFSYTVADDRGGATDAGVDVTVNAVNDAPVAADDGASTDPNAAVNIDVLGNDTDVDGDALGIASVGTPGHGTAEIDDNGTPGDPTDDTILYTPNAGYHGVDSFTYTATDGTDPSNAATVTVDVLSVSDIVSDDFRDDALLGIWTATLPSSGTAGVVHAGAESYLSLVLPDGEFDAWFGQNNTARLLQASSNTDFEVEAKYLSEPTTSHQMQGILVQQDASNWLRFDLISFSGGALRVFAGSTIGGVSTARIQIQGIAPGSASHLKVNRAGDTWTLSYSGDGQSWTLAGSFDQALNVTAVGPFAGSHGDSTGYVAQLDYFYNTAAPLAYEDPAPVATVDDEISALPDVATPINVTTDLLANDQDGVGAGLSVAGFGQPGHGTTALDDNGTPSDPSDDSIVYTPNGGYLGPDSFTYTVQDAAGQTADGTVNVTVSDPTNTAPAPVADAATTDEDVAVIIDVLGNDDDPDGDPLTITAVTDPAHGTAAIDDNGTPSDPSDDTIVYTPDADYNGPDSFSYTVADDRGGSTSAGVDVTVNPVNDAPAAADDGASTNADTAVNIDVLNNDTDVDGDAPGIASVGTPGHGTAEIDDNGTPGDPTDDFIVYTPDAGYTGPDSFTYTATDGTDPSDPAIVTIDVKAISDIVSDDFRDDALLGIWTATLPSSGSAGVVHGGADSYLSLVLPTGNYDAWFGQNDTARLLQAASDTDFEVEAKYLSEPTVSHQMQGILVQQDAANWLRFDLISFSGGALRVFAGSTIGGVSTARISVQNITPGEAAFLRVNREGDTWTLSYSADGQSWTMAGSFDQALNVTSVGPFAGSHGGAPGYEAQLDYFFNSAAPLAYEDPAPVAAVDDDIAALPDTATGIAAGDLLANDQDGVGAGLSVAGFGQPGHGATALDDNGTPNDPSDDSIVYTPDGGFLGVDSFTYTVEDAAGQTALGTVNVTVADPGNTAPTPVADTAATDEDVAVVIDVLGNDTDPNGDPLTIASVTDPAHGTAVIDNNGTPSDPSDDTIVYTPDADYNGPDSFSYTVADDRGGSTSAGVDVTVNAVNDAPVANDDGASTAADTQVAIAVLGNDSDVDGDAVGIASVGTPGHGTAVIYDNGTPGDPTDDTVLYTPETGYRGVDSFTYAATDGTDPSDPATVTVEVGLGPGGFVSDDFSDPTLDPIWTVVVPVAGSVDVGQAGDEAYLQISLPSGNYDMWKTQPNGVRALQDADNEDFQLEAKFLSTPTLDAQVQGILVQESASKWLRFDTWSDGSQLHVFAGRTSSGSSQSFINTTVAAASATHLRVTRAGDLWTLDYSGDGISWTTAGSFSYALNVTAVGPFAASTHGSPGFISQVDYFFNSAAPITAEDNVQVPPVANDDAVAAAVGTPLSIGVVADLLANDGDANGDSLSLDSFTQPGHGATALDDNGTPGDTSDDAIVYTPDPGYIGADSFTYTITDNNGGFDSATVNVTVSDPTNTAPAPVADTAATDEDVAVVIDVLGNDTDPNGDPLTITSVTDPAHGAAVIDDNGTPSDPSDDAVVYTPDADYNGPDSFGYTVADDRGGATSANVDVTVNPVNDAPVANDDTAGTAADSQVAIHVLANDTDVDGDALGIASVGTPGHGSAAIDDNGTPGNTTDDFIVYTPDPGYSGPDLFTYTATDGTDPSTPASVAIQVGLPAGGFVSDDFYAPGLGSIWTPVIPVAGTIDLGQAGNEAYLELTLPTGDYDMWKNEPNGVRVLQDAINEDFQVEARFLTEPSAGNQVQGILIQQSTSKWLRFDTWSDGNQLHVFAGRTDNGSSQSFINVTVADGSASHLRVTRVGSQWTLDYSSDGASWTTAGTFAYGLNVTAVGPFAASANGAPGYTAQVDYFFNSAAPIAAEDNAPVPPVARDDSLIAETDTPLPIQVAADLLANDTDGNNDPLSLDSYTQPSNGATALDDNGTPGDASDDFILYTPGPDYAGTDSFTYTITDQNGGFDTATVDLLVVDPNNNAPTPVADTAVTDEDVAVAVDVLGNDTDPDGNTLTITAVTTPANGTAVIDNNGTPSDPSDDFIVYTPDANFNGADSFTYTVADGRGGFTDAGVDVTVDAVNDAPVAVNDELDVIVDTQFIINAAADLLANDTDIDGDSLSVGSFTQPTHGLLEDIGGGQLRYTPDTGYSGLDSFTYTASDSTDLSDPATVAINVRGLIDVWYGYEQTFADIGQPQQWVNILGNAAPGEVVALSYSLNDGPTEDLILGPDTRRLVYPGDFNIDIDYADLDPSPTDDVVHIYAQLSDSSVISNDVIIKYEDGAQWPANYSIDWSTVTDIQDVVQVVDGLWELTPQGIHPDIPGYDRIVTFGDASWDSYQVDLTFTASDFATQDPRGFSGLLGFGFNWNGHTESPTSGFDPLAGYLPSSGLYYGNGHTDGLGVERLEFHESTTFEVIKTIPVSWQQDTTYHLTLQVDEIEPLKKIYRAKIWADGDAEPTDWTLTATEIFDQPTTGAFYLNSHWYDVTFGNIAVTEIVGNDTVIADDADNVLVAVDTNAAHPGAGETDTFVGKGGADTFVFGDANGAYYNDGVGVSSGVADYGFAWDFQSGTDQIQLFGTAGDYALTTNAPGLPTGTAIWLVGQGGDANELIAVVHDVTGLDLQSSDFVFTGDLVA